MKMLLNFGLESLLLETLAQEQMYSEIIHLAFSEEQELQLSFLDQHMLMAFEQFLLLVVYQMKQKLSVTLVFDYP